MTPYVGYDLAEATRRKSPSEQREADARTGQLAAAFGRVWRRRYPDESRRHPSDRGRGSAGFDLDDELDLDWRVERQHGDPDRAARVHARAVRPAAEDLCQQVARTVHHA